MMVRKINNNITDLQPEDIRNDFPIFQQAINGKPLVYLDSAASAQKPYAVIEEMSHVMEGYYANIHRGLYQFSQQTTSAYENARKKLAGFGTDFVFSIIKLVSSLM